MTGLLSVSVISLLPSSFHNSHARSNILFLVIPIHDTAPGVRIMFFLCLSYVSLRATSSAVFFLVFCNLLVYLLQIFPQPLVFHSDHVSNPFFPTLNYFANYASKFELVPTTSLRYLIIIFFTPFTPAIPLIQHIYTPVVCVVVVRTELPCSRHTC